MTSDWGEVIVAGGVVAGFAVLTAEDIKTSRVVVAHAVAVTALAVCGLGFIGIVTTNGEGLAGAAIAAMAITGIQLVPYRRQRTRPEPEIGRADVRLAIPFGWTLGYFGLGFALVGFAFALVTGLGWALSHRSRRHQAVPFVPFLTIGLVVALFWAATVAHLSPLG